MHKVKVPFCMAELFNRKIITHRFRIDGGEGDTGIGYAMIISHVLMVRIGLIEKFKSKAFEWDDAVVSIKEPGDILCKTNLAKSKIR